jgi:hypothetical protein
MQRWADEVEKRRGKRVAVLALARKLAGILYAIWRDGTASAVRPARRGAIAHTASGGATGAQHRIWWENARIPRDSL